MKILIFLQGTVIMHKGGIGKTREERVKDSIEQAETVRDFASYVPIGHAPEKLQRWIQQGAEICYLSALTKDKKVRGDEIVGKEGLKVDQDILDKYGFPKGEVYHRDPGESYADITERVMPDILIEDDCESIGGEKEMTYTNIKPELKPKIKQIIIKEFEGIDHLPDDLKHLKDYGKYIFSPYHPLFEELFKKELTRLEKFLDKDILIEHVGSTAVKALGGKGIIDILIGAPRDKLKKVTKNLQSAGYEFIPKASTENRLFFQQDLPDPVERVRRYHIHLTFKNSEDWINILVFRDFLKSHPEEQRNYEELKKKAVNDAKGDGLKYREIKDSFIKKIIKKALSGTDSKVTNSVSLVGKRIKLVPITLDFTKQIFQEFTHEITTFMYPQSSDDIADTEKWIKSALEKVRNGEDLQTVILNKETGEFLGCAGLHSINTDTPELGIWIKKGAHGYGLGQEAIATLVKWAEENLDYKYLKYPVDKRNIASRKIPESLGGIIEDEYKKPNQAGQILDEVEYRIYQK